MGNFEKRVIAGILLIALGTGAWKVWTTVAKAKAEATAAWAAVDSGRVKLAATKADKEQYAVLLEQAKRLSGKATAGVTLVVPKIDTLWRDTPLDTELLPDSTRLAEFAQRADDGTTVHVSVTAPPCCDALSASVRLEVPADTLTVGFIEVGNRTVVTATSKNRKVETVLPFATPPKAARTVRFVELLGDKKTVTVRGGVGLRLTRQVFLTGVVDKRFTSTDPTRVLVGGRWQF